MSHPWKAQPYYMMRQARTSAPVPAPMGFGGFYSRGSFAPKSPWNVPDYIADQRTGVNGLGASGDCVELSAIQGQIKNVALSIVNKLPATGISIIDNGKTMLVGPVADALANLVKQAAGAAQGYERYIEQQAANALRSALSSVLGPLGGSGINFDSAITVVVPYLRKELIDIPEVCPPDASKMAFKSSWTSQMFCPKGEPACVAVFERARRGEITPFEMTRQINQLMSAPKNYLSMVKVPTFHMFSQDAITADAFRRAAPATAPVAQSGGISPVAIGAAALAALMLLK